MQGVLITAYKDKEQLINLVRSFEDKLFVVVHIDKKCTDIDEKTFDELNYKNIIVIKKYRISWGSFNHLLAIIDMLKIAKEKNLEYIHIISGQDIMVKNVDDLIKQFENNKKIYCSWNDMQYAEKKMINRYRRGILSSKIDMSNSIIKKIINYGYGYIHIPKKNIGEFSKIYKGVIYVSLPKEAYIYCLEYIEKDKKFLKDLKHCFIPEEFFFQTILTNSIFNDNIVKDNLRYIDWNLRNGSTPAILDENDYDNIKRGNYIFARKIDTKISNKLINLLKKV